MDNRTLIYLDDFVDEVLPMSLSECTPKGWALWLSGPDSDWGRDTAASEGDQFRASVTRLDADIIATRTDHGWQFSRELEAKPDLLAIRYGQGFGWDAQTIVGDMNDLAELLSQDDEYGPVEYIAVGYDEPPMMATYRKVDGLPTLTLEPVQ